MSIFKACDIRGTYGAELTEEVSFSIGRAVGTLSKGTRVCVAGDTRGSTPPLKEALTRGLIATGMDVVDIGVIPTPAFHYAVELLEPASAVMVTASHNPAEYNGFKVVFGGVPTSPEQVRAIETLVVSGEFATGRGSLSQENILARYADWVVGTALPLDGYSVVIDAAGGCVGLVAPEVFERLGARIERLYCEPDGDLSGRNPNPAALNALADLQEHVRSSGAGLGIGFDGDGDRVIFVDDKGCTVSGDLAGAALLKLLVPRRPQAVVIYDLKCSSVLSETARELGFDPRMERSGYAFMRHRMLGERAIFGCELSGHLFFGELNGRDDALYAATGLVGILAGPAAPRLSEVLASFPPRVTTPDLRIPWDPKRVETTIAALSEAHRDLEVSRIDGIRVDFGCGWALARPSVTEPLITLRFEADSAAHLQEVIGRFLSPTADLAEAVAALLAPPDNHAAEKTTVATNTRRRRSPEGTWVQEIEHDDSN